MDNESIRKIVMTKKVARQWLLRKSRPEYRILVMNPTTKNYASVLRSFRDGKLKMAGVRPLPDLGVKENFGGFWVWSSDKEALRSLQQWFTKRGLETSWIW